jgi:WYL_2, Sm-like SH3 beta-barrel fold
MSYNQTTVSNLINVLDENVTRFQFKKMDGSIRTALGTRNESLIPKEEYISTIDDISPKSVVFWDLEEKGFRSFSKTAEVAVI